MKNIFEKVSVTFDKEDLQEVKDYCKKIGISFNEFIRKTIVKKINEEEEVELLDFIMQKNSNIIEKK
ncbi:MULTISPECIES: DUF6290 family protein [Cetobacterium]|jgi:predicted urease superfamily metal-dependent hydrolase|uniref:DUF6290 family protein n=1 Tax=Candidatus Cetobacterium colombiensis TaxID=3073100 RepID=A0ABU4WBK4_9FUSO|nr:DUF6290 family protein [Candidatus Cetobacterium colombiensis]MDX8336914.1 DUF6290 family protein [Candidatus Cetobacterium colombiensis]